MCVYLATSSKWIIIGSDLRPETKQEIEGKIVRFRSGRVTDRVRDKDCQSEPDRRSKAITFGACLIQIADLNLTPCLVNMINQSINHVCITRPHDDLSTVDTSLLQLILAGPGLNC